MGNGSSISIYNDKWILRPSTFKILSIPKLSSDAKVNCLISSSGAWNVDVLRQNFDRNEVEDILSIPIGSSLAVNSVLWHFDERGHYNVKSGYVIE